MAIGDNLNSSMLSEAQTKVATAILPALEDQDGFFEFFKEAAGQPQDDADFENYNNRVARNTGADHIN